MDKGTKEMILEWVAMHNGDTESVAEYMRDSLGIGGLISCRAIIKEAFGEQVAQETVRLARAAHSPLLRND